MSTLIGLPVLNPTLAKRTGRPAPSYRQIYAAVLDGRIPAEKRFGRWYVNEADLPAVATAFGMDVPSDPATM